MELTILRHAESEFNHLGVFQGRLNCSLSKDGIMQTREKVKNFDSSLYDICFSSPLIRTLQTSRILVPDLPIVCDNRIIERNLGDWQNTPITVEKLNFLNQFHLTPPNGESMQEILSRVQEFIDFLREKYYDKRILVITHAGIIYALQVALDLDIKPIDNLEELTINLSSKRLLKK